MITWLAYRKAIVSRSGKDNRSLTELAESARDKYHVRLLWVDNNTQLGL